MVKLLYRIYGLKHIFLIVFIVFLSSPQSFADGLFSLSVDTNQFEYAEDEQVHIEGMVRINGVEASMQDVGLRINSLSDNTLEPIDLETTSNIDGEYEFYYDNNLNIGAYYLEASCGDADKSLYFIVSDKSIPLISNAKATNKQYGELDFVWTTNEPATSKIEYGETESYELGTIQYQSLVEQHKIRLYNQKHNTKYFYRVSSIDNNMNEATNTGTFQSYNGPYFVDIEGDGDSDSVLDSQDNCLDIANPGQENSDDDSFGDACDNCPDLTNLNQEDNNDNGIGDLCEDKDNDGYNLFEDCDDSDASIHPGATEICNNANDNCNQLIDEDLTRECGDTNKGICTFGEESCYYGVWINCDATFPETEINDNLDNDCDGQIDEDFMKEGESNENDNEEMEEPEKESGNNTIIFEMEVVYPDQKPNEVIINHTNNTQETNLQINNNNSNESNNLVEKENNEITGAVAGTEDNVITIKPIFYVPMLGLTILIMLIYFRKKLQK
ncbi:putative metal-binding motif-containing protein [Candidatus Woesearchaeota archaeon]|nr:putative metal-binding motif-containing protein [Candidatus Woesearchaeota archaeon]